MIVHHVSARGLSVSYAFASNAAAEAFASAAAWAASCKPGSLLETYQHGDTVGHMVSHANGSMDLFDVERQQVREMALAA